MGAPGGTGLGTTEDFHNPQLIPGQLELTFFFAFEVQVLHWIEALEAAC
jgi:hypothetical protein